MYWQNLITILRLVASLVSLFFIGYAPAYFILLYKKRGGTNFTGLAGKFFIFFISFYLGLFISSIYLITLSLAGIKFSFEAVWIFSLVFFLFFLSTIIFRVQKNNRNFIRLEDSDLLMNLNKPDSEHSKCVKRRFSFISDKNSKKLQYYRFEPGEAMLFRKKCTENTVFAIMVFLIILNTLAVLFFTWLFPVRFWDAISCWSLKAKAFFTDGSILPFYTQHNYDFSHLSYPLLIPLAQAWEYIWMGTLNETLVKTIFALFYISLIFIIYYLFRQRSGKAYSAIATFIISGLPIVMDHGYIEYTNLVFAVILLAGVYFLRLSVEGSNSLGYFHPEGPASTFEKTDGNIKSSTPNVRHLMLAAVFFAILASVRSEGMLFLIIFFIIAAAINLFWLGAEIRKRNTKNKLVKEKSSEITTTESSKVISIQNKQIMQIIISIAFPVIIVVLLLVPWMVLNRQAAMPGLSVEWAPVVLALKNDWRAALASFDWRNAFTAITGQLVYSKYDSVRAFFGSSYGIIWVAMFMVACFNIKRLFTRFKWIYPFFILAGFISVFLSLGFIDEFAWSTDRYLLHLLPLTYYWIFNNLPLFKGKADIQV